MDSGLSPLNTLYGCVLHLLDSSYFMIFGKAYLLTISIESLVCYALNHRIGLKQVLGSVALVNSFSLPIVWFLIPDLMVSYSEYVLVAEGFAILSEWILMKALMPFSWRRAAGTSIAMNVASFGLGIVLPWLIL
jgi:hypothetical protein